MLLSPGRVRTVIVTNNGASTLNLPYTDNPAGRFLSMCLKFKVMKLVIRQLLLFWLERFEGSLKLITGKKKSSNDYYHRSAECV